MAGVDDAGSECFGDMQAEEQEGDEVEKGRPEHGILRPQHAGRNDCGDGVGRIVQAVEEVEEQGDRRPGRQAGKGKGGFHQPTFSMTMPLISLATSSKRSTTFSSWS